MKSSRLSEDFDSPTSAVDMEPYEKSTYRSESAKVGKRRMLCKWAPPILLAILFCCIFVWLAVITKRVNSPVSYSKESLLIPQASQQKLNVLVDKESRIKLLINELHPGYMKCGRNTTYVYDAEYNRCIRLVKARKTWMDAKKNCEERGEHLLTLSGKAVPAEWINGYTYMGGRHEGEGKWYWNGLSNQTSIPLGTTDWGPNQPNSRFSSREECVAIYTDRKWHDVSCYVPPLPSICERATFTD